MAGKTERVIVRHGGEILVLEGTPEQVRRVRRTIAGWKERMCVETKRVGRRPSAGGGNVRTVDPIRVWAREAGIAVGERGRISSEIREAYDEAMMWESIGS